MSAETIEVGGRDYVVLPHRADWSKEPELTRRWETKIAPGISGAEDRARMRQTPLYTLKWSVTAENVGEESRIAARVLAAKESGYAAAPWFGRGMRVQTAVATEAVFYLHDTNWIPATGGFLIIVAQDEGSEPIWEIQEVLSSVGNEVTIVGTLDRDWPTGTFCYPLLAGEFTCDSHPMLTGEQGEYGFSIEGEFTVAEALGIQVDGFQSVALARETYADKWGPYIQVDGYQAVVAGFQTDVSVPWGPYVQIDAFQAVVLVLET